MSNGTVQADVTRINQILRPLNLKVISRNDGLDGDATVRVIGNLSPALEEIGIPMENGRPTALRDGVNEFRIKDVPAFWNLTRSTLAPLSRQQAAGKKITPYETLQKFRSYLSNERLAQNHPDIQKRELAFYRSYLQEVPLTSDQAVKEYDALSEIYEKSKHARVRAAAAEAIAGLAPRLPPDPDIRDHLAQLIAYSAKERLPEVEHFQDAIRDFGIRAEVIPLNRLLAPYRIRIEPGSRGILSDDTIVEGGRGEDTIRYSLKEIPHFRDFLERDLLRLVRFPIKPEDAAKIILRNLRELLCQPPKFVQPRESSETISPLTREALLVFKVLTQLPLDSKKAEFEAKRLKEAYLKLANSSDRKTLENRAARIAIVKALEAIAPKAPDEIETILISLMELNDDKLESYLDEKALTEAYLAAINSYEEADTNLLEDLFSVYDDLSHRAYDFLNEKIKETFVKYFSSMSIDDRRKFRKYLAKLAPKNPRAKEILAVLEAPREPLVATREPQEEIVGREK